MVRAVASLTTMPDKYRKIVDTLRSLQRQTHKLDAIYLSLPARSRRLDIPYPPLPEEIKSLCTVVECQDYGPITKIIGGLLAENDPDTVIITFDDDMMYPESMVEKLLQYHKRYPNSALGSSGMLLKYNCPFCAITPNEDNFIYQIPKFPIPAEGRRVDSLYGYPGALYLRKFFPANSLLESQFLKYALIDNNTLMNDDIVISGYLSAQGIERRIFRDLPRVAFVTIDGNRLQNNSEISYDLSKFFQRMNGAITACKSLGMYSTTEALDFSESIAGISAVVIICVLLIIAFFIYIMMNPIS